MPQLPRPHPDVVAQEIAGEVVLVHLGSNDIFTLNQTATTLWNLLSECEELEELLRRLFEKFDVDRQALEREVRDALGALSEAGLVRPR